jgi:hypothetical protein
MAEEQLLPFRRRPAALADQQAFEAKLLRLGDLA